MHRFMTCALVVVLASTTSAQARRVSDARLKRILRALADTDLRIRAQALIALGKLRDRRAVPRISRVLHRDRRSSVRALAAAALGSIGDPAAIPTLRRRLRDRSRQVRRQVRVAIARLTPQTRETHRRSPRIREAPLPKSPPRIVVKLGAMGSRARGGKRYRAMLRGLWRDQIGRSGAQRIDLLEGGRKAAAGATVYSVSSSITRMHRVRRGASVQASCTVSVTVDKDGSIVMMTSGGATVEVSARRFRRKDARQLDSTVLRTAIASAHQNLLNYFKLRR